MLSIFIFFSDVYDLEEVKISSQTVIFPDQPSPLMFSASVYNVKNTDIAAIASSTTANYKLKVRAMTPV